MFPQVIQIILFNQLRHLFKCPTLISSPSLKTQTCILPKPPLNTIWRWRYYLRHIPSYFALLLHTSIALLLKLGFYVPFAHLSTRYLSRYTLLKLWASAGLVAKNDLHVSTCPNSRPSLQSNCSSPDKMASVGIGLGNWISLVLDSVLALLPAKRGSASVLSPHGVQKMYYVRPIDE